MKIGSDEIGSIPAGEFGDDRLYLAFGAAYVRGHFPEAAALDDEAAWRHGIDCGLRLHRFKRKIELPRVQAAIGMLKSLSPAEVLDIGSGRGTFLWPMMDELGWVKVTSLEADAERHRQLACVQAGGLDRLDARLGDAGTMPFGDGEFDVVTVLEVLEHLADPAPAARECLRVARRAVVATVPSQPDDNPEHLRLFTPATLAALFQSAGAASAKVTSVRGHLMCFARPR
jgi:2-polyprenyl-3-methyl-5-hydroxy-6-metoxy-1,4-benzoquinol methylase